MEQNKASASSTATNNEQALELTEHRKLHQRKMEKTCYGSNVCQEYFTGLFFPCRSYPTEQNEHLNLKIQTEKKCISVYTQLDNESITHDHLRMTQTFMKKKKAGCRIVMVDNNYTIYS